MKRFLIAMVVAGLPLGFCGSAQANVLDDAVALGKKVVGAFGEAAADAYTKTQNCKAMTELTEKVCAGGKAEVCTTAIGAAERVCAR